MVVSQYFKLYGIMRYKKKQYFPKNLKLAGIAAAYKKRSNFCQKLSFCQCIFVLAFESIIQKCFQILSISFYLQIYVAIDKVLTPNMLFFYF